MYLISLSDGQQFKSVTAMLIRQYILEYKLGGEKIRLRGFLQGQVQSGLCSHRRWLEARNFGFKKDRDCTIFGANPKALISCAITEQLICAFVFACAKLGFLMTRLNTCKWDG